MIIFINPGACENGSYSSDVTPQFAKVKDGYVEFLIYGPNVHIVTYLALDCCAPKPPVLSGGSW
jgi:hypothetical protein